MKSQLKSILSKFAPSLLGVYQSINNRLMFRSSFGLLHKEVRKKLYGESDIVVLSGVFKGLKYFDEIVWGPITPKWLGSYEAELTSIIEQIVANKYDVIIDIGCAEGYYATGLAYRITSAQVFAYDTDFISRRQTQRLAKINSVGDRVEVAGFCSHLELGKRAVGRTVVVCDIEGFERELLDPVACPQLLTTDILVEIHENAQNINTLKLLKDRFAATHLIAEVSSCSRIDWIDSFLKTKNHKGISISVLQNATNEHRTIGQKWLWLRKKRA